MNVSARIAPAAPLEAQRLIEEQLKPSMRREVGARRNDAFMRARRLGEVLVRMGRLDHAQVENIIAVQRRRGGSFGRHATRLRMVSRADMAIAIGVEAGILRDDPAPDAIPSGLIVAQNPYSPEAEAFRLMRARLIAGEASDKTDLISVVGAHEGAGANFIAANLAASLAQLGRRILLIDADLRRPALGALVGLSHDVGLSDMLAGGVDFSSARKVTLVKGLDFLAGGGRASDPQSLLCRPALGACFASACAAYDHVLVHTAPFGSAADGEFVWSATKNVLVVARRNEARGADMKRLQARMRNVGAEIVGAVMTG